MLQYITLALSLAISEPDEYRLIDYFLRNRTAHYQVLDRESDKTTTSVAATGFGYYAWVLAEQKGIIKQGSSCEWINKSLDYLESEAITPAKNKGWLFHWIDSTTGRPKFNMEVSTIDTALYYKAALRAAQRLGNTALLERIQNKIENIDIEFMMRGGLIRHGLIWDNETPMFFIETWDHYSEGVILYRLFDIDFSPAKIDYNLPLFVYYYPLCFYEDEDYIVHLKKAVAFQKEKYGAIGITACDGPQGYTVNDPLIVSPLAVWATSFYSEDAKTYLQGIKYHRTTPSYHRRTGQIMDDKIGIDYGSCLMIISKGK